MIALLTSNLPWLGALLAGLVALIVHLRSQAKVAQANQQTAEAQTKLNNLAAAQTTANAQADATAANARLAAKQEAQDAATAPTPTDADRNSLRDKWTEPAPAADSADPNRGG